MTPRRKSAETAPSQTPRKPRPPAARVQAKSTPETPEARQRRIAALAYTRFLARGGEHGHALEDWLEAERQIASEERQRP